MCSARQQPRGSGGRLSEPVAGDYYAVLAEISALAASGLGEQFDGTITDMLRLIGEYFEADRAYLFLYSEDLLTVDYSHEWCAEGITPQRHRYQDYAIDHFPWWRCQLEELQPILIPSVAAMPPAAAAEQKELLAQDIQSLVCITMQDVQGHVIGFIGLDAVETEQAWSESVIRMLQVVAEIISGAIQRNQAILAAQASETRLRTLAELGRQVVWEVDCNGLFTYVSQVAQHVYGYASDELVGKRHFFDLHPEEGREQFIRQAFEVFQRRESFTDLLNPIETKSGQVIWVSTNGIPVYGEDGELKGYAGCDSDVTEREQAQALMREHQASLERRIQERTEALAYANTKLIQSEARYRRVVRATHSFVFHIIVSDGRMGRPLFDASVEDVTGYSPSDFARKPALWRRIICAEDVSLVLRQIRHLTYSRPINVIEHRIRHKDGSMRWVRSTTVAEYDHNQRCIGYDGLITDVTARKVAERERDELLTTLKRMATRDAMTGLLNRAGFYEELGRLWNIGCRHPFTIGLLVVDVDHFKSVNDTFGHLTGDALIEEYASVVKSTLRDSDLVCRYGGDELVIILPWSDLDETIEAGERMRERIVHHIFCKQKGDLSITVSIGAHAMEPHSQKTIHELISLADRALYQAKQNGRDQLCVAQDHEADAGTQLQANEEVWTASAPVDGKISVLVVDDDPHLLEMMRRCLKEESFVLHCASNVKQATMIVEREKGLIHVALVDLYLGNERGLDFIAQLQTLDLSLVPIVMTGEPTLDAAIEAMRSGSYDFVQKPFKIPLLMMIIRRAMEHRRLMLENQRYQQHLEAMVARREYALARALEDQKKATLFTLEAMAALIDAREQSTGEHCRRVAEMTSMFGREMGVTFEELETLRRGALLHDIGKIAIPDEILLKKGKLTEQEQTVMRRHPSIGYEIIASSPELRDAAEIVWAHQERYDGTGYPRGLRGDQICIGARIFSVIDAYDAMRSNRLYRSALSPKMALAEILRHKGTQFDPDVVDAFLRCQGSLESVGYYAQSEAE